MACWKRGSPGTCGCGSDTCGMNLTANVKCGGFNQQFVSVSVTSPGGTTYTGLTNSSGNAFIPIAGALVGTAGESWTYSLSKTGFTTTTGTFTFVCGVVTLNWTITHPGVTIAGNIYGCSGFGQYEAGATITFSGAWSGSTTSNSSGAFSIFVPVSSGVLTVTVSKDRFVTKTRTLTISCGSYSWSSEGLFDSGFTLEVDPDYVCLYCGCGPYWGSPPCTCHNPVARTLYATSDLWGGEITLEFNDLTGFWEAADVSATAGSCTCTDCNTDHTCGVLPSDIKVVVGCGLKIQGGWCVNLGASGFYINHATGATVYTNYSDFPPFVGTYTFFTVYKTTTVEYTNYGLNITCQPFYMDGYIFDSPSWRGPCTGDYVQRHWAVSISE